MQPLRVLPPLLLLLHEAAQLALGNDSWFNSGSASCRSCDPLQWRTDGHEGRKEERVTLNKNGCMIARISCSGSHEGVSTFVEFNSGRLGGSMRQGPQSLVLECSENGRWKMQDEGDDYDYIETISCSAAEMPKAQIHAGMIQQKALRHW